jgi:hypothetical protein
MGDRKPTDDLAHVADKVEWAKVRASVKGLPQQQQQQQQQQ